MGFDDELLVQPSYPLESIDILSESVQARRSAKTAKEQQERPYTDLRTFFS